MPEVISPLRVETDHNGVNVVNGKLTIAVPVLSVPGAPNLQIRSRPERDAVRQREGWRRRRQLRHRQLLGAHRRRQLGILPVYRHRCLSKRHRDRLDLPEHRLYKFRQAGSGAFYLFNLQHIKTTGSNPNTVMYYASQVTYPNGEVISYTYNTAAGSGVTFYRPITITSNLGFFISISYQADTLSR